MGQHQQLPMHPAATNPYGGVPPSNPMMAPPTSYLKDMLNSNPSFTPQQPAMHMQPQPQVQQPQQQQQPQERPSVPSKSNQPMVTIRRVENPVTSQPTVTISMKNQEQ